ncbi:MAG: GtrA family protein [Pseudomonas sp.]
MKLLRQGGQFVLIGLLQLLLDWAVFVSATALGVSVASGNLLGRVSGATLGFWLNGRYTFAERGNARLGWRRLLRFALVWIVLTVISTWLIGQLATVLGLRYAWLGKPVVEGLLAMVSFFIWRHLVFR